MASSAVDVKWQTSLVIHYLFEDEDDASHRLFSSEYETDGPGSLDDNFDPVEIGEKLKHIGDGLNVVITDMIEDAKIRDFVTVLKQAAPQETINEAFSHCVDAVRESHVQPSAEVAPELQLIKAAVAVGLCIKKSAPELKVKLHNAVTAFFNMRVDTWIGQQGGWENVPGL